MGGMSGQRGGKKGLRARGQGRRSWSREEREMTKRALLDHLARGSGPSEACRQAGV